MNWNEKCIELDRRLHLRYGPIAFKAVEKAADLAKIDGVVMRDEFGMFCQLPYLVRVNGLTVAATAAGAMNPRCKRTHGLENVTAETKAAEAAAFVNTWMGSVEDGLKQQEDYPRMPLTEALVMAPLATTPFEPDAIILYANPAQMMLLLCGMQKIQYERFTFHFIGEGSCVDSLAQCLQTGKPGLTLPCYGERAFGTLEDDELVLAMPPAYLDRALQGMPLLEKATFSYPIERYRGSTDIGPMVRAIYKKDE
ncbi:MAG: DUF169 domain-containing protein [Ruminococcaceae bacterium]|nr:DUF169 domain-containing protein [Oscillospiraceae bacterium]